MSTLAIQDIETLRGFLPEDLHFLCQEKYHPHLKPFLWNFTKQALSSTPHQEIALEHIRYFLDKLLTLNNTDADKTALKHLKAKLQSEEAVQLIHNLRAVIMASENKLEESIRTHFTWLDGALPKDIDKFKRLLQSLANETHKHPGGHCEFKQAYVIHGMHLNFFANDNIQLTDNERRILDENFVELDLGEKGRARALNLTQNYRNHFDYRHTIQPLLYLRSHLLLKYSALAFTASSAVGIYLSSTMAWTVLVANTLLLTSLIAPFVISFALLGSGIYHYFQAQYAEAWLDNAVTAWYAFEAETFHPNIKFEAPEEASEEETETLSSISSCDEEEAFSLTDSEVNEEDDTQSHEDADDKVRSDCAIM